MGKKLHALGLFAFNHPWRIISGWVLLVAVLGFLASQFIQPTVASISIPGTQAQLAIDRTNELFPDSGKASGRIVFQAPDGYTVNDFTPQILALTTKVSTVEGVSSVVPPFASPAFISESGAIAYAQVQLKAGSGSVTDATITPVEQAVETARINVLQVEMSGDLISKVPGEILGIGEIAGVLIALVVLLMTLGSLVAAGMPIITALVAIAISMAGLFSMSQLFQINSTTPVLAVMLGLAVGIDYSLFIINKYRRLVRDGHSYKAAAGRAVGTAGNAVIFAALTVVIALSALSIVNIPFMTMMGLTGAATIAVAALVSISLVPAMLGVVGRHVFSKKAQLQITAAQEKGPASTHTVKRDSFWYKWGEVITGHPIIALFVSLAIITTLALPVRDLQLGLPTDEYASSETTQKKAYDILTNGFGVGFNGPLTVVVEGMPVVEPNPALGKYATFAGLNTVAKQIGQLEEVAQVLPAATTADGTAGVIQVIPSSAPSDDATHALIKTLRNDNSQKNLTKSNTISLAVTGSTALQMDINDKLGAALPQYLVVVVGLSLVLLVIAFRSILVPLKATIGFLLSVLAMFGSMVAVFQWGWFGIADAAGPIVSFIPIITIGILFGLAMDYEFFLVSSMHEVYEKTKDAKEAVITGFGVGSKVVTAAGIIMVSVFSGFIFNHDATIQAVGFGLAVGILVDAFIVRMTIVPAIMTLLDKSAWWLPRWLDRRLPHVSIEGKE
jgi:RND superfamily putative drug exporter